MSTTTIKPCFLAIVAMAAISTIFSIGLVGVSTDGKQEALLCALKPFLRPERREGIDRAMQLAKLSQLAGIALKNGGLMGSKGG